MRPITHASLFSGIGGPEIAAAMLGWSNLFHCEINPFSRSVLEYWFPKSESYADIKETNFSKWAGKVDVLTGGFPCQPFSHAGKRRGANDDRYLWPQFKRVISETMPTWVVGENVAGITTMVEPGTIVSMESQGAIFDKSDGVQRYRQEQPFTIERVCQDLEDIGYSVQPILIPACAVGAPHRRDRVFFIANANSCANRRNTRQDAGESEQERLQEWNEIRQSDESNQIRSSFANSSSDTYGDRFQRRLFSGGDEEKLSTGTPSQEHEDDGRFLGNITNTESKRRGKLRDESEEERPCSGNELFGICRGLSNQVGDRWSSFPTVAALHRGNDGFPFNVDCLTIPFAKWRNESIKAYGNAIVPQVMYEIFRAIQATMQTE